MTSRSARRRFSRCLDEPGGSLRCRVGGPWGSDGAKVKPMAGEDYVREVYDASYLRLVVQLYALTGDLADAEDAVQEAFVTALGRDRAFARLDNCEAWLRTV